MKFKRFLTGAFLFVCMMFMSSIVVSAASSGTYGQNCTWTLDDEGTLIISGSGITPNYSKDMYRYIPWYSHMAEIKKAVIDGPENIGDRAFFYARNMEEVVIGRSVKSIGEAVFTGCTSLKNIDIPSNVTKIYSSAFSGCTGITKLTIPDSVTTLGSKALEDMTSLQELTVPFIGTAIDNLGHLGWWFQSSTTKVPGYTWTSYGGKYYLIPRTLTKITVTSCRVRPYGFNNCEFVTDRSIKDHTGGGATCASPAVCEVCGQTYGEKDASNHTGETEIKNAINATCLEAGYTGDIYCKGCKVLLETGTETEALGHDMTKTVSERVEPTCHSEGKEAVIGCSRCNHTEGGAVIAKTDHTWDAGTITKEATCTVKGKKTFRCTAEGCDAIRTEETALNPEKHVNKEVINTKEATCTEAGYTGDTYCKDCKKTIETGTETEALGHDMTKTVSERVEPTCEAEGKEVVIGCTRCDYTEGGAVLKAVGHIWDEGKVTKEPDENSEGVKTYTCEKCNKTKTESIPKKDSTQKPQPSQPVQKPQPTQKPQQSQTNVGRTDDKKTGKYVILNAMKKEVAFSAPVSKNKKTVTIPNTVKISGVTYKVTQIADNAFRNNKKITKVTIGNNVRVIGNNAFRGAARLKTVVIGKNVSKIGSYASSGCKKLKTIIIKTRKLTTKTVSRTAFKGTPKTTTVKVPGNKTKTYKKLLKKKGLKSKKIVKG